VTDGLLTPRQLASKVDRSPQWVRARLRKLHPRRAEEKRRRWQIPDEWAKEIKAVLELPEQRKVVAIVVSQKGTCAGGHTLGNEFLVGDTTPPGMCSWAFYALFPFSTVLQFGGSFPWGEAPDKTTIACPDPDNPVVFELRRLQR